MLATCATLTAVGDLSHAPQAVVTLLALGILAAATAPMGPSANAARLGLLIEGTLWAIGVLLTGGHESPLLPYLLAPAFAGGIGLGLEGVLLPIGIAALTVLSASRDLGAGLRVPELAAATSEWVGLSVVVGLLAAWINRLQQLRPRQDESYLSAYRLLGQLRAVARRLSTGLDRVAHADAVLRELRALIPQPTVAALYSRAPGDRLAILATSGAERVPWRVRLSDDSIFTECWTTQRPQSRTRGLSPGVGGSSIVLPLVVGDRTIGLIGLEIDSPRPPTAELVDAMSRLADEAALRLETSLLFDELRELATVEERRRLAREIHDGVAQDLAAFGYQLDAAANDARSGMPPEMVVETLGGIRKELGRLIGELRSSIFELRTEVDQHGGLGAALTDYVRAVGAASDLTVHVSLAEGPERLPADTEAELLRIAQEAVTNARKHANAQNLWVHCTVDPPQALLVVSDDGTGPGKTREGSFGLAIMQERAERLGARLDIGLRDPHGTKVTCRLGPG